MTPDPPRADADDAAPTGLHSGHGTFSMWTLLLLTALSAVMLMLTRLLPPIVYTIAYPLLSYLISYWRLRKRRWRGTCSWIVAMGVSALTTFAFFCVIQQNSSKSMSTVEVFDALLGGAILGPIFGSIVSVLAWLIAEPCTSVVDEILQYVARTKDSTQRE